MPPAGRQTRAVATLVHTWLILDFFGDARRKGGSGSTLTTTIFTQSFLALVFGALLYPETRAVPFAAANLTLSSLLVAIGLLGDEDRLGRRRADHALLRTSPLSRTATVAARSGHSAFYVCLITIGMALPPAILLGFLTGRWGTAIGYVALACVCSGLSAGALAVALRLAARLLGQARAALLGGTAKALLLGGGLALFAIGLQNLRGTADDLPIGRLGAEFLPTYQAARLLAHPGAELWRLGALLAAGAILLVAATALGDRSADTGEPARRSSPLRRLLRLLAGRGPRLGLAEFVATMMWRSPGYRARVLPLLGLPAGMVYLSLRGGEERTFVFLCVLLQLPAIYLPFLIAFLPRADQENTRWLFDQAPPLGPDRIRDATWRALVTHILLPVHLLAAAILVPTSPAPLDMLAADVFSLAVAVVVARPLCRALLDVPFTDDRAGEPMTELGSLFPLALALLGLAIGFGAFLGSTGRLLAAAVALAVASGSLWPGRAHAADTEGTARREEVPQTLSAAEATTDEPEAPGSLARELRAIALLYAAMSIVPTLLGSALADGG